MALSGLEGDVSNLYTQQTHGTRCTLIQTYSKNGLNLIQNNVNTEQPQNIRNNAQDSLRKI